MSKNSLSEHKLFRNKRFEDLANNSPNIIWMSDVSGTTIFINKKWTEVTGQLVKDALGYGWLEMVHPDDRQQMGDDFLKAKVSEQVFSGRYRLRTITGAYRWVADTGSPRIDNNGSYLGYIGGVVDIHEAKTSEEALYVSNERFRAAIDAIEGLMWITDEAGNFLNEQPEWEKLTGQTFSEYQGFGWTAHIHPDDLEKYLASVYISMETGIPLNGEHRLRNKLGEYRCYSVRASPVRNTNGTIREWVGVLTDISEIRANEQKILHLATHDPLTNLPNRILLEDRIRHLTLQRNKLKHAILFMDLNRFKVINDTLGHSIGDQLLIQIANLLQGMLRVGDIVARIGGDEFVVVLENVLSLDSVTKVGTQILDLLAHPIFIAEHELILNASIGIAIFPEDGEDETALLRHADLAMYKAKLMGGNAIKFYDRAYSRSEERLLIERDLRHALENEELLLNFQPKVNTKTMRVDGVEALLRWQHPLRGLIPPNDFIPLAEEIGLIFQIGEWVLCEAATQIQKWKIEGIENISVAVNLSVHQLLNPLFIHSLKHCITKTGIDPCLVELEITESKLMENIQSYEILLKEIKSIGFTLAIDDFGTGYSSLSYLKKLPIETIKIDRSFIQDIMEDKDDAVIVCATISMALKMGLAIIAEGVETKDQAKFLHENGCNCMQGYYFSRPLTAYEVGKYIKSFNGENTTYNLLI